MSDLHPVLAWLQRTIERSPGDVGREKAVVKHGRPFVGIDRPKGYRQQRKRQNCFFNAALSAMDERGTYVEGFVLPPGQRGCPVHHAWITLGGVHAIDQTLANGAMCQYFGIPFTTKTVAGWVERHDGWVEPLLNPYSPELVRRLLSAEPGSSDLIAVTFLLQDKG